MTIASRLTTHALRTRRGMFMKIAVIGCGIGSDLVRNLIQSNKIEQVICCDLDQKDWIE